MAGASRSRLLFYFSNFVHFFHVGGCSEYPLLMGCANLGVCLHTSTSGIDLPMKVRWCFYFKISSSAVLHFHCVLCLQVLDMFGSGVAVCAAKFPALSELVQHDVNGKVFSTEEELAGQMFSLLFQDRNQTQVIPVVSGERNWKWESAELQRLRCNAATIGTWDENWAKVMEPLMQQVIGKRKQPMQMLCESTVVIGLAAMLGGFIRVALSFLR